MTNLAIISIVFGSVIIVGRAPLIFVPEASLRFIQKLVDDEKRIRIMGIFVSLLSLAMIAGAWGADEPAAAIIKVLGWILAFGAAVELLVPSAVCGFAGMIWNMSVSSARVIGVISVAGGAFFISLGFWCF